MSDTRSIVITTPNLAPAAMHVLERLGARLVFLPLSTRPQELAQILARENPHGIISRAIAIDARAIDAAPNLRVISKYGVGYDNLDIAHAARRGIPVLVTRGANSQSVAELTIGLMISLARDLRTLDREVRAGRWIRTIDRGMELSGRVLALVGYGAIGRRVGGIAAALGMQVHAYDPYIDAAPGITLAPDLDALLARADVLSLHCPLSAETRRLLDAGRLARLKTGALVVNTARGEIVDDEAMVAAVETGHVGGYAADTYSTEPPGAGHPLLKLERAVFTPHCGAATAAAAERVALAAANNLVLGLEGRGWQSEDVVNRTEASRQEPAHADFVPRSP